MKDFLSKGHYCYKRCTMQTHLKGVLVVTACCQKNETKRLQISFSGDSFLTDLSNSVENG